MQSIHFLGRVLPPPARVTVSFNQSIKWEEADIGLAMEFTCHIENSKIDIECRTEKYRSEHLGEFYRRALDICRAQVDLIAFKMGWGLTVVLETFIDSNGIASPIFQKDEGLAALCTAFSLDQGFGELCAKVIQSVPLFMALRDLVAAISLPHVSLVDCARAMDRLKHLVATPGTNDKQAWQQLQQALQIDEAYLKYITDYSANPRHGRPGHTPGTVTTEVTRRSWVIMNRYFEYLKRGNVALDSSEFPLLVNP
ncbi:MAG: hypothetical protein ABSF79_04130 [Smithellaceae bacterium]|jgi:hypothetical protein